MNMRDNLGSNITLRHKFKSKNSAFIALLHFSHNRMNIRLNEHEITFYLFSSFIRIIRKEIQFNCQQF